MQPGANMESRNSMEQVYFRLLATIEPIECVQLVVLGQKLWQRTEQQ